MDRELCVEFKGGWKKMYGQVRMLYEKVKWCGCEWKIERGDGGVWIRCECGAEGC